MWLRCTATMYAEKKVRWVSLDGWIRWGGTDRWPGMVCKTKWGAVGTDLIRLLRGHRPLGQEVTVLFWNLNDLFTGESQRMLDHIPDTLWAVVDLMIRELRSRGPALVFMGGPVDAWHYDTLYDELCERIRRYIAAHGIWALPCSGLFQGLALADGSTCTRGWGSPTSSIGGCEER